VLTAVGLRPYLEDPTLYTNSYIVIIVFVNDFLAVYYTSESTYAYRIRQSLEDRFEIKHISELS
jgi:hypothetical protein